ncbi:sigma-70 family RNA polymerase sigma factor [Runella sp. MFBS21]|uniref:RNA polymerase sigma factor n=1 Tax=Runella sp. MFBS21 TaxID=3034018 RepID=UPI0023F68794|nr:sigma-70 family RNA polymerase sigma factor [Runella sp. MFBS21]MDF7816991.1 sigma-70 family RNA polymerase sigma factor [Runella sp. MFBS21]
MPPKSVVPTSLDIWQRLKASDSLALGELYDAYVQVLFKFGRRICTDDELITDAIHDVFEDLWLYRSTLSVVEPSNIQFYLFKALKTKLLKLLTKQNRHTELSDADQYDHQYVESVDFKITALEQETQLKNQLTQQIASLPKRQKEALLLRFYDNLSYEEIADLMAVSRHSVYNLVFKALTQLRENLALEILTILLIKYF